MGKCFFLLIFLLSVLILGAQPIHPERWGDTDDTHTWADAHQQVKSCRGGFGSLTGISDADHAQGGIRCTDAGCTN
jgi:hypothetical protein